MMGLLLWVGALALATVFLTSLRVHLRKPGRAESVVASLRLPRAVAHVNTGALAVIAVMLILSPAPGGIAAVGYILIVTTVILIRSRGERIEDCGCFDKPHAVGIGLLVRNSLLALVGVAVAVAGPTGLPVLAAGLGALAGTAAAALVIPRRLSVSVDDHATARVLK